MLTSLGVALEDIDTAIQSNQAERSIDEQTALVSAARRLDALLKCGVTN